MPGKDGRGQGGDGNPSTTQATEAQGAGDGEKDSMGRLGMAAAPRPHRGMAAENDSVGTLLMNTAGTNSASPEHGALARHKYGLLVPTVSAVDLATTGDQGSKDSH